MTAPCHACSNRVTCGLLGLLGDARNNPQARIQIDEYRADAVIPVHPAHLYVVRSGAVKAVWNAVGRAAETVIDFSLPGQLFGLEAQVDAQTLEKHFRASVAMTCVCSIGCAIKGKSRPSKELCERFNAALASRIGSTYRHTRVIQAAAQARVAEYMMQVLQAAGARGVCVPRSLPNVPRSDIASYLRLRTETLSRVLSQFRKEGWIRGPIHRMEVLEPDAIAALREP